MSVQILDTHQHFWKYDPVRDDWITEEMMMIRKVFDEYVDDHGFAVPAPVAETAAKPPTVSHVAAQVAKLNVSAAFDAIELRHRELEIFVFIDNDKIPRVKSYVKSFRSSASGKKTLSNV